MQVLYDVRPSAGFRPGTTKAAKNLHFTLDCLGLPLFASPLLLVRYPSFLSDLLSFREGVFRGVRCLASQW